MPRYLTIHRTYVYCDGPQLVMGEDGRRTAYLAVAIPHPEMAHGFLAVQVSDELLEDYLRETIDLRFVFKRPRRNKYFLFALDDDENGGRFALHEIDHVDDDWLPDAGFFSRSHTEREVSTSVLQEPATLSIGIDGRWDIQDLSHFPNKFADAYSFLYAMRPTSQRSVDGDLSSVFARYPWRGGFSTVGFYNDLYFRIPRHQRLTVRKIQYASPGTIEITALPDIASEIQVLVEAVNNEWKTVQEAYRELHDGMSDRELLGRSHLEITLSASDKAFLERATKALSKAIGFKHLARIHRLVDSDWLVTGKILASFYRRIEELAEFYESGKAKFT